MPRKSPYARVSITLPREILAVADRLARAADRPRSWVIAEAIRIYPGWPLAQPAAPAGAAEVAAARHQHLLADLQLAPEERLRRAAALLHLAPGAGTRRRAQIIGFDSYEDFATWKKARRVEGLRRS
ncbi:MAG: ribbon-helix-helix domain-containing protein [Gemmatimonadales bacterium]